MWRLATGDSYRSCGLMFKIAKSTAVGVCRDFVQALSQRKEQFIQFPNTPTTVREKIQGFREKSNFPNVVGAIDGTHIQLFRERLSNKSVKAYATIPKGIMGCGRSLLHPQVQEFSTQWKVEL